MKKNLFFFPSRLVFQTRPEAPKPEEAVERAEKALLKNPELYGNVDNFFKYAKDELEKDAQSALESLRKEAKPEDAERNKEAEAKIREGFEAAKKSLDEKRQRFERVFEYSRYKARLQGPDGPLTIKYERPISIVDNKDYNAILLSQKALREFQDAHKNETGVVKDDFDKLDINDRINYTRTAIDTYYSDTLKNDRQKLDGSKKNKTPSLEALTDLDEARAELESFGNFEGGIVANQDKYRTDARNIIRGISQFIAENAAPASDRGVLTKDINDNERNLMNAQNAVKKYSDNKDSKEYKDSKAWEAGAREKSEMVAAKVDMFAALGILQITIPRGSFDADKIFKNPKISALIDQVQKNERVNFAAAKENYKNMATIYREAIAVIKAKKGMEAALVWFKGSGKTVDSVYEEHVALAQAGFEAGEYKQAVNKYEAAKNYLEGLVEPGLDLDKTRQLAAIREEYPKYSAAYEAYTQLNRAAFAPEKPYINPLIQEQQKIWAQVFEGPESTNLKPKVTVADIGKARLAIQEITRLCNNAAPALQAKIAFMDRIKDSGLKIEDFVAVDDKYKIYVEGGNFALVSGDFGAAERNFDRALGVIDTAKKRQVAVAAAAPTGAPSSEGKKKV